ncbi:MAG TPA: lamin tail domain-containing protein [Chitinophagaceae bacterium]|nr:lamin tail domain-containing protein [Chitinophagaceae bacterium]
MENFNDGDYSNNPTWSSSAIGDWVVNSSGQLQSNNQVANSTFYISTPGTLSLSAQWEFYSQLSFNTSSANYVDVFLTASASNITLSSTTGYFLRMGSSTDEVSLYRKDSGGAIIKIIDGVDGTLNTSNNTIKIKVIRDGSGKWTLFRDLSGTGTNYASEGFVTDNTYSTSSFFGILIKQSTSSFFQRHFFDDIIISTYTPDVTPPVIVSANAVSSTTIDLLFSEPLEEMSSQTITNYTASNGLGNPIAVIRDAANTSLVHITFANTFPNGINCTLSVSGIKDLSGNVILNSSVVFNFYSAQRYDVVIDELMVDPTPQVGLPNAEWIELKNTTAFPINLQGWKIGNGGNISGSMPNFILKPDSFVIVCSANTVSLLSVYGKAISVSNFPSLDNDGEILSLLTANDLLMHAVAYSINWYQNPAKSNGGWTLEMIDTRNPCSGISNWGASTDLSGGTPGKTNAVDGHNKDLTGPNIVRAVAIDAFTLELTFDETLDSAKASVKNNYFISDGIGNPISAKPLGPLYHKVIATINIPLVVNKIYTITINSITDCSNNQIESKNATQIGLASNTDSLDIVINEILFNPKNNGYDYVELYNRSNKILDFKQLYLANQNSNGQIANLKQLSDETIHFYPGEYIVITENREWVKNNYLVKNADRFIELISMPTYSNDTGQVILYNINGKIIDEVDYSDRWHFSLIENPEGVSLERIDYNGTTQTKENWHSAAASAGYGTPTYQNSQFRIDQQVQGEIKLTPDVFSPDNDGFDDFLTINYQFPERGYVANITVFDANGRVVRALQKNALCAASGYFRWDGLDDKQGRIPAGIYIIYTEIFNLKGKTKKFKNATVLAKKF